MLAIGFYIGASAKMVLSHRISLGALVTTINATFLSILLFGGGKVGFEATQLLYKKGRNLEDEIPVDGESAS